MEATSHHTDGPDSGETHPREVSASEFIDHGVLDMGFNDDTPQELPGMEVDVITPDETDLTDL